MSGIEVNLNDQVFVILTQEGADAINNHRKSLGVPEKYLGEPVQAGEYRRQLWLLMQELGPSMHMGGPVLLKGAFLLIENNS